MISIRNRHTLAISLTLVVMLVFAYALSFNFNIGTALAVRIDPTNCHNTPGMFCNNTHWCIPSPTTGGTYYFPSNEDKELKVDIGQTEISDGVYGQTVTWSCMPGFDINVSEIHLKASDNYQKYNPNTTSGTVGPFVSPDDGRAHALSHVCIQAAPAGDPEEPIITPSITVRKTAPLALEREAGSSINIPYAVYVTNNSHFQEGYKPTETEINNLCISKVVLNDELLDMEDLPVDELKIMPGNEACVWSGFYNYSGPDGTVTNVVYAKAFHSDLWSTEPPARAEVSTEISSLSEPAVPVRSILVEKIAPSALVRPADGSVNIPYSVYVTNTSTVPEGYELTESEAAGLIINQVMLKDDLLDMNWTAYDIQIARGERKEITGDPLVYEAYFDGTVTNTVYAKARFGRKNFVEGYDDAVTDITSQVAGQLSASIGVTKTPNPTSGLPGTVVTYTCVIENTGDYRLDNLTLTDYIYRTGEVIPHNIGSEVYLPPHAGDASKHTVTFTYTIPAGANSGDWENQVTITGQYPNTFATTAAPPLTVTNYANAHFTVTKQPDQPQNPGGGGTPSGGDGPSANYGQQETVSIPSETPVNSPAPQQEALQIPVETPVAAPLAPIAPKGELPFTGGDPLAFGMAGMSLLGVAAMVRRYFQ